MGLTTDISWTDATWNPWIGCTPCSAGCFNCYAARWARRTGRGAFHDGPAQAAADGYTSPLKWPKPDEGQRTVFVCSLSDYFDPRADAWREDTWTMMRQTPWNTYILLTKRPERIPDRLPHDWPLANVGLGVTVENQANARWRVPLIRRIPAAFRVASCEPLIGPVDFLEPAGHCGDDCTEVLSQAFGQARPLGACYECDGTGYHETDPNAIACSACKGTGSCFAGIYVGGETADPKDEARPMHPDWARKLRDDCEEHGLAYHFKAWGEWTPYAGDAHADASKGTPRVVLVDRDDGEVLEGNAGNVKPDVHTSTQAPMYLIGRRRTGRRLDGKTYDARPEAGQ